MSITNQHNDQATDFINSKITEDDRQYLRNASPGEQAIRGKMLIEHYFSNNPGSVPTING